MTIPRMRWACSIIILSLNIAVLTGCGDWRSKRAELAKKAADDRREVALINGYYSADIGEAERSLLGLVDYYSTLRCDGVAGTLGLTHGRLFLVYTQCGRTNDAVYHRDLALKHYRGEPNETEGERWADILDAIEKLDKNREVKWKTNK